MSHLSNSYSIVAIQWRDTHADPASTWTCVEELSDDGPCIILSVGFLLPNVKERHVSLAQSLDPENNIDTVLHIPVEMVETITLLSPEDFSPFNEAPTAP